MTLDSDPAFKIDCLEFAEASLKEVVLLGLIAEEPSHAYGLEEKIRTRRMTDWTNISISSIYRVLSGLQEKGLIDTHLEHEGQGATRKVHAINAAGRRVLAHGVAHHLTFARAIKNPISVALAFITHAPHGVVVEKIAERVQMVNKVRDEISRIKTRAVESIAQEAETRGIDSAVYQLRTDLLFTHILHHIEAEAAFLAHVQKRLANFDPDSFYSEDQAEDHGETDLGDRDPEAQVKK